jgi:hypothetical protein
MSICNCSIFPRLILLACHFLLKPDAAAMAVKSAANALAPAAISVLKLNCHYATHSELSMKVAAALKIAEKPNGGPCSTF